MYTVSLLTTRNMYVYKNIRLYFYFWRWYLCGAEKQLQRVRAHEGAFGRRKSQWTTDDSRNSGTYIVYNSHVTNGNFSFSLTMVTPTSHFFAFHWLCCLLSIGFLSKPGSVGLRLCHYHAIQPCPQFRWYSDIFDQMHLWAWWHFDNHLVDIILEWMQLSQHPLIHRTCGHDNLSTTSAVFILAGHDNILHFVFFV